MNQKILLIVLSLGAGVPGCRTTPSQRAHSDIAVTLHRPTLNLMISDVSQRNEPPQRSVRENADGSYTTFEPTDEDVENWKKRYTAPVDLVVKVTNTSTQELKLFEEWNSWGYYNLKIVFGDGFHEYWVTKQPGVWYRNFSSFHTLASGQSFQIPVAFADHIWSGLDQVRANSDRITSVRAFYEQYQSPIFGRGESVWRGSTSSDFYRAAEILPQLGCRSSEQKPDQETGIEPVPAPPADITNPDEVKIEIKL